MIALGDRVGRKPETQPGTYQLMNRYETMILEAQLVSLSPQNAAKRSSCFASRNARVSQYRAPIP